MTKIEKRRKEKALSRKELDEKNKLAKQKITFEEISKAAENVIFLLRKKGHPHMTVIITDRSVKITEDIIGMPLDFED